MIARYWLAFALAVGGCAGLGQLDRVQQIAYDGYQAIDAQSFAAGGGPVEIVGAPVEGATPQAIAEAMRLPGYLTRREVTAIPRGRGGTRMVLVFAPAAAASARDLCRGEGDGGVASAELRVQAAFCRGDDALSQATLVAPTSAPGEPAFQRSMLRLFHELAPLRLPRGDSEVAGCPGAC